MMYLDGPPQVIETRVWATMPAEFRRPGVRSDWADANRGGKPVDCFIEGPSFDASGNLYVVDISFGRIFRIATDGAWSLIIEYDGWPNGLMIAPDGRILVADYMNGLMELDARRGTVRTLLGHRISESFKGCNDLHISSTGDIYFTDQGQTRVTRSNRPRISPASRWTAGLPDLEWAKPEWSRARPPRNRAVRGNDA